jgi:hypothetical protein
VEPLPRLGRRLSELAPSATAEAADDAAPSTDVDLLGAHATLTKGNGDLDQPDGIKKSGLVLATPRPYRNREHLRYVAQQACLICGRKQSDPHHLRYLQPRALGGKASDEFAVPLCRSHHRAVHRAGDEQAWWKAAGIDPSLGSSGDKPGSMIGKSIQRGRPPQYRNGCPALSRKRRHGVADLIIDGHGETWPLRGKRRAASCPQTKDDGG